VSQHRQRDVAMPVDPQADFVLVQAGFLFRLPSYSSTGQLERSLQPDRPGFTSWTRTPSSGSRLINDQNAIRRTRMLHDLLPQIIPHVIGIFLRGIVQLLKCRTKSRRPGFLRCTAGIGR
jgi:hypothetical protein